jgi:hypothetical protein
MKEKNKKSVTHNCGVRYEAIDEVTGKMKTILWADQRDMGT